MNPIRICTVVTGTSLDEFLQNLEKTQQVSDLIELRVDYIQNIKPTDIEIIKQKTTKLAIFTCRRKEEGGQFTGSDEDRLSVIQQAIKLSYPFVDIEYATYKDTPVDRGASQLILSYHNFDETPPYWQLTRTIFEMSMLKPDIIKIATMVQTEYDNQKLMRVLLSKKPNENQIIIGMGEKGKITRVLGPLLGSYLTFASANDIQTTPGQIHINTLKIIYNQIRGI